MEAAIAFMPTPQIFWFLEKMRKKFERTLQKLCRDLLQLK
jgi:hypothetical protein